MIVLELSSLGGGLRSLSAVVIAVKSKGLLLKTGLYAEMSQ